MSAATQAEQMIARIRVAAMHIAAVEIWVVSLLVVAGAASTRALPLAVVVAAGFWPVRWLATGRLTVRTPGDWAIGLLVLMVPVTLWATALPEVTQPQVLRLLTGIALYYAVANWATTASRLRLLANGLVAAGLALAALAPFIGGAPAAGRFIPATATGVLERFADAVNPNIMAGTLALLAPLALAWLLFVPGRLWNRVLALVAALGMAGVIALSQSRGAWIALVCAALLLIALRWRWGWLMALAAIVSGTLVIWWIGLQQAAEMVIAGKALGGADQRLEIWSRAIYMLQDFPFTGIGMGAFRQVANLLYPFFLAGPDAEVPHAHNLFLQVGVDLGLPGLVAWLALFLLVCVAAWQVYRWGRTGEAEDGAAVEAVGKRRIDRRIVARLGAGLLASQVVLAVHGLFDAATWGTRPAVIVWAVWGIAAAAHNVQARGREIQHFSLVQRQR